MEFQVRRVTTTDKGIGLLEVSSWPVREGLSNNCLQQTARWQFAAPLLKQVFYGPYSRDK